MSIAQIVQLPSYRTFGISTAVSVPDGGTSSLGGSGYASAGSRSRGWGPYGQRSTGGFSGGSSVSVSAQVIDLAALDEVILAGGGSAGFQPSSNSGVPVPRGYISSTTPARRDINAHSPGDWQRALGGVDMSQRDNAMHAESDVRYYLEKAKNAENANRVNSARVYYRMAVESMSPQLLDRYNGVLVKRAAEAAAAQEAQSKMTAKRF